MLCAELGSKGCGRQDSVVERDERRTTIACSLYSDEAECARSELVAVRVDVEAWRQGE